MKKRRCSHGGLDGEVASFLGTMILVLVIAVAGYSIIANNYAASHPETGNTQAAESSIRSVSEPSPAANANDSSQLFTAVKTKNGADLLVTNVSIYIPPSNCPKGAAAQVVVPDTHPVAGADEPCNGPEHIYCYNSNPSIRARYCHNPDWKIVQGDEWGTCAFAAGTYDEMIALGKEDRARSREEALRLDGIAEPGKACNGPPHIRCTTGKSTCRLSDWSVASDRTWGICTDSQDNTRDPTSTLLIANNS